MPLQETSGNVTTDAYGGGAAAVLNYIEDVFSTYLYTGNGSTQTITNGIDLSTKGGLVWIKARGANGQGNNFYDTARGVNNYLISNSTGAQNSFGAVTNALTAFNTNGFSLGDFSQINFNNDPFASWTFRKQPKFFDVVTWTGDGSLTRDIAHSLASTPGCVMIKRIDTTSNWKVSVGSTASGSFVNYAMQLNTTDPSGIVGITNGFTSIGDCTSTTFRVRDYSGSVSAVNASGGTYVAYLFAHNAGGFGLTGTDNVISCGSFTTDASGNNSGVTLGYEPQYLLLKKTNGAEDWYVADNMRGFSQTQFNPLIPDAAYAEATNNGNYIYPTATGFACAGSYLSTSSTYIYIAIRRGPMKVPTDGTKVFAPVAQTGGGTVTTNFPVDMAIYGTRSSGTNNHAVTDRLRGADSWVQTNNTNTESQPLGAGVPLLGINNSNVGYTDNVIGAAASVYWNMRRAPSFFDEVCYDGTGTATNFNHNLGVAPELMIVKRRNISTANWAVYHKDVGNTKSLFLNLTNAPSTNAGYWNNTTPTSSVFTVGNITETNGGGGYTYVAYLFATCAGVSKIGSYTGNGSTQTINCGFTGGARFVLIKRTDAAGDWYVYDTARGMTTLTDPYLLLNSTAAESATLGSVTTVTTGFAVNASILAAINTNAASYIFLAIA